MAKAKNLAESVAVEYRLKKKYPQMYDKNGKLKPKYSGKGKETNWASKLYKNVRKRLAPKKTDGGKPKRNLREKAIEKQTGLPEKTLKRLR